jgi:hypothetical protein
MLTLDQQMKEAFFIRAISTYWLAQDTVSKDYVTKIEVGIHDDIESAKFFFTKQYRLFSNYSASYKSIVCYSGLIGIRIINTIICYD